MLANLLTQPKVDLNHLKEILLVLITIGASTVRVEK
jgi:hypothetical protein